MALMDVEDNGDSKKIKYWKHMVKYNESRVKETMEELKVLMMKPAEDDEY
jgi:hypothetical protein